jgi:tRNA A-37 threonylcarbamoyl transferase component Bud32
VPPKDLEQSLRDLPRVGKLVRDYDDHQVWRFEHNGKPYYLKFYPRTEGKLLKLFIGNPAMREFLRLQWLQKASIPSPRAVAVLSGFRIGIILGDAVISEGIEPSQTLDQYLNDLQLRAEPIPNHLDLSKQIRELVHNMALAKLRHSNLRLESFLIHDGKIDLLDALNVHRGMPTMRDIMLLGHSASRFATKTDIRRAWDLLAAGPVPKKNPVSAREYGKFNRLFRRNNEFFGRLDGDGWRGVFFKRWNHPRRWSRISRERFTRADWEAAWPQLLAQVESEQFEVLKRGASGDVLAGEIVLGGRPFPVIIKRPRVKYAYRYITALGRPSRALRTWRKAWKMIVRDVPVDWPMFIIEKLVFGYVVDSLIVFERVPGKTLAEYDLDARSPEARDTLFRRLGRILRRIDSMGFGHFDAKATNWIITDDEKLGPTPVMIDADGVRHYPSAAMGMRRLLRAMRDHPQYTPADSLSLCLGYAPFGRLGREPMPDETTEPEEHEPKEAT